MKQSESLDNRQAIIQAVLQVIARKGFHGTPMLQIAKQAGFRAVLIVTD